MNRKQTWNMDNELNGPRQAVLSPGPVAKRRPHTDFTAMIQHTVAPGLRNKTNRPELKSLVLILALLLSMRIAMGFVPLPVAAGTNAAAQYYRDNVLNTVWQTCNIGCGRIDRLEHEVDRLEAGFTILAVLFCSSLAALCLLVTRDKLLRRKDLRTDGKRVDAVSRDDSGIEYAGS